MIESLHGMSHNTIPHTNLMLQKFGETTGAWKTVFDNDLANLLPANIKKYDAIFLNDIVGEAFADPAVRESLLHFVKNGGGLIGKHGTPWASRNWTEFTEMIGAMDAPHRIEKGIMRVYDPASPLVKLFDGKPLPFKEEYYRFHIEGAPPAAVEQRAGAADGRSRRSGDRAAAVGQATSGRTRSTRCRGSAPTARAGSSTPRSATCRKRS